MHKQLVQKRISWSQALLGTEKIAPMKQKLVPCTLHAHKCQSRQTFSSSHAAESDLQTKRNKVTTVANF
jgi:hypothetical protein